MPTAPWQYRAWPISFSDLLLLVIVLIIATWINAGIAGLLAAGGMPWGQVGLIHVAAQAALLFLLLRAVAVRWRGLTWPELGLDAFDNRSMLVGILMGILAFIVSGIVYSMMQATQEEPLQNPQQNFLRAVDPSSGSTFLMMVLMTTVVAFVEELAFRGLIYGWLRQRFGIWLSVIASSLFFAAMHDVPMLVLPLTAVSIILALLYEYYRSIWPCVIAHGTFNGINLLFFYASSASEAAPLGWLGLAH